MRAAVKVGPAELDSMPNLKVIARTGVGVDDVDVDAATERGIPVAITPGVNSTAVAEGAFAHMLQLVKSLAPLTEIVRSGGWSRNAPVSRSAISTERVWASSNSATSVGG